MVASFREQTFEDASGAHCTLGILLIEFSVAYLRPWHLVVSLKVAKGKDFESHKYHSKSSTGHIKAIDHTAYNFKIFYYFSSMLII